MKPSAWQSFHIIDLEGLDQVIRDVQHEGRGDRIYYAIDPYEIYEYCFPLRSAQPRRMEVDVDKVADSQIALYHVFNQRQPPPVLLKEYHDELRGIWRFTEGVVAAYNKLKVIDEFIQRSGLEKFVEGTDSQLFDLVAKDFNILLTVVIGLQSLGLTRLNHVMDLFDEKPLNPLMEALSEGYVQTELSEVIFEEVVGRIPSGSDTYFRESVARSAKTDSLALDRLFFINNKAQEWLLRGRLKQTHIFLYLSSAARTSAIFSNSRVKDKLPLIHGEPYPIWRTRSQVFVRRVYRSLQGLTKLREVLVELPTKDLERRLASVLSTSKGRCQICILEPGGQTSTAEGCRFLGFCQKLKSVSDELAGERASEMSNLALMRNIEEFSKLANNPENSKRRHWVEIFAKILERRKQLGDQALHKIRDMQFLTITQSKFAKVVPDLLQPRYHELLREGRDAVTAAAQYLPTKPKMKSTTYDGILQKVVTFYQTPVLRMPAELQQIVEGIDAYLTIDAKIDTFTPDHEITRCFLYLSNLAPEGDTQAFEHAKSMRDSHKDSDDFRRECDYVMCWAARRSRNYSVAIESANDGLKLDPDDARFYHGRALALFAWLHDENEAVSASGSLGDVIAGMLRALDLYRKSSGENRELVGVCLNNLAFCYSLQGDGANFDLRQARAYLKDLKELIPKSRWDPWHPEYLHTEAWIEYREILQQLGVGVDPSQLESKLSSAMRDIEAAYRLYPSARNQDLRDKLREMAQSARESEVLPRPTDVSL